MFDIALGIFLFLSPIFFLPIQIGEVNALQFYQFGVLGNAGYNYLQLLFFGIGIITLLIIAMLTAKPQREFDDKWSVFLFSGFCISILFHPIGIKLFSNVFLGFLLYYMTVVCVKNYKTLFKFIFCISLLNTIFAILQLFNINLIYGSNGGINGLMCLSNQLGFYQALSIPICYSLNPYLAIIPLIGLILSKSILAMIALVAGMVYFLYPKLKKIKFSLIYAQVVASILFILVLKYHHILIDKFKIRGYIWIENLKLIHHKILFGHGLNNLRLYKYEFGQYENAYSIFLQLFYMLGIIGLFFLGMFLKDKFVKYETTPKRSIMASCIILLVIGLGFCFMDFPRLAGTAIVLFGLLTVAKGEKLCL